MSEPRFRVFWWWLRGSPCTCGADTRGHARWWQKRPSWCIRIIEPMPLNQHRVADEFWRTWQENEDRHGFYESTWIALRAALAAARGEEEGGS